VELLSYMRLFVEVARTKSFRRTAEALDMPNSTVSRHIAELEKAIGLRLLHRSTRKVELTEAGEVYFKRCQSIVEEALVAHESLLDLAERPTGILRVSMPVDLAIGYLTPILADFAKTYPLIGFELDLTPRPIDLLSEAYDLALRIGPLPAAPSMLVARQIAVLQRHLYAAPAYLKHAPPLKQPQDLVAHVMCIAQAANRQGELVQTLYRGDEAIEVATSTRYVLNNVGLSRALAAHGVGIAAMDAHLAGDEVASGRLVRVLPEWSLAPVPVHAITDTRMLPARTRLFIDFVRAKLRAT